MPEPAEIRRFRVGRPEGPHRQPPSARLVAYFFPVTLELTVPVEDVRSEVKVVLTRLSRFGLSGGPGKVDTPDGEHAVVIRLWYWVKEQVPGLLDRLLSGQGAELRLTDPDFDRLSKTVPEKVGYDPDSWFAVHVRASLPRQVFISCSQVAEEEIALGKEIEARVSALPGFRGYFAQNQDSWAGVTDHILRALYESVALICVMHHRGQVVGREGRMLLRGSVWIEQEIAIAALMEQVLDQRIVVRLYCEKGIAVEGLRRQIMVHPVSFEKPQEVLEDLTRWLPLLSALVAGKESSISTEEEHSLIEQGIGEYPILGSAKRFLDRYATIPPAAKRRIHGAIVSGQRANYGRSPEELTEDHLKKLYPDK